jgi:hypothetical protein
MSRSVLFAAVVIPAIIARLWLASFVPPGNAPDERAHYNYVRVLAQTGEIPIQPRPSPTASDHNEYYQPPLYYILATPVYWLVSTQPEPAQFLALRSINIALSMLACTLCLAIARVVLPDQPDVIYSTGAIALSLPAFAGTSSSISNDMLLCVLVQAAVWMLLRAVRRGRYRAVEKWGIALLLAAGLWVKFSAISLIPVLLVGAWWLGRDAGPQGSSASVLESTRGLVIAALPVAVGLAGAFRG